MPINLNDFNDILSDAIYNGHITSNVAASWRAYACTHGAQHAAVDFINSLVTNGLSKSDINQHIGKLNKNGANIPPIP